MKDFSLNQAGTIKNYTKYGHIHFMLPIWFSYNNERNIKWRMVLTGKPKLDKISMVIPWEININSSFSNLLNKENERYDRYL